MIKTSIKTLLIAALLCTSSVQGASEDDLQDVAKNTEELYQPGGASHDGSYTAVSASMIAWGVGLAVGIAVLAAVLHQSKSSSSH